MIIPPYARPARRPAPSAAFPIPESPVDATAASTLPPEVLPAPSDPLADPAAPGDPSLATPDRPDSASPVDTLASPADRAANLPATLDTPTSLVAATDAASPPPQVVEATRAPLPSVPQSLGLSNAQRTALQALAAGHGVTEAAAIAKVHLSTLFRWRKRDARFIAALNAWRGETEKSAHDTLLAAAESAAGNVLAATQKGDVRTSLTLLKGLEILAPRRVGSMQPAVVARELAVETGLFKAAVHHEPRKISLHLLEQIFDNMEMGDATRAAYRDALARHRADIKSRPQPAPLLRPVTPEALRQAADAMLPVPGRSFKYVAEPTLAEYARHQKKLRDEQKANADPETAVLGMSPWLGGQTAATAYPPKKCRITITAVGPERIPLAEHWRDVDNISIPTAIANLNSLPCEVKLAVSSEQVESFAGEFEALGATVEIRPAFDVPDEDDESDDDDSPPKNARQKQRVDAMNLNMFNKTLDQLLASH